MPGASRPYRPADDEPWPTAFLDEHLGGRRQARRGELFDVLGPDLGLVAAHRNPGTGPSVRR